MIKADTTLDTVGLYCPMPIILTSQKLKEMNRGDILEVLSDDEGIKKDMPVWCKDTGHEFLQFIEQSGVYKIYVRKGQGRKKAYRR